MKNILSITEEMIATFQGVEVGTVFTTAEIKQKVCACFGRNPDSIIPSDYCYNRINNGIAYEKQPHIFEYQDRGNYVYLGLGFPYTGKVYHKPKGDSEFCVGELLNGVPLGRFGEEKEEVSEKDAKLKAHRTGRNPGLGLRFRVMQRDNFKCCICGVSPAKDPSVELHIDHIIPWSKGGETVFDNLQTLCSKCNLGKSDLL